MMLAWPIRLTARASWTKRSIKLSVSATFERITLTATRLPITACTAPYTVPMPPSPSTPSIR